jgi:general secretion pathway protein A
MQRTLRRFFGLRENPFHVTPDPRFLVVTDQMRRTLAELTYAIETHKGLVLLTGEVGTGKTLLVRHLLDYLRRAEIPHALIFNPHLDVNNFFNLVLPEFGLSPRPNVSPVAQLRDWLALPGGGHRDSAVLIVDEAQGLGLEVLEEIRLLSNADPARSRSLQVILAGQPELDEKLKRPEFRAIRNRISIRCSTRPLSRAEVDAYIGGRLKAAGASTEIAFPSEAANLLYFYSRGIPRLLNVLCEHSLLRAYSNRLRAVSAEIIEEVAHDLQVDDLKPLGPYMQVFRGTAESAMPKQERAPDRVEAPFATQSIEVPLRAAPIDKTPISIESLRPLTAAAVNASEGQAREVTPLEPPPQEIPIAAFIATNLPKEKDAIRPHSELLDEVSSSAAAGLALEAASVPVPAPVDTADDFAVVPKRRVDLERVLVLMTATAGRAKSHLQRSAQRAKSSAGRASTAMGRHSAATCATIGRSVQRVKSFASRGGTAVAQHSAEVWATIERSAQCAKSSSSRGGIAVGQHSAETWAAIGKSGRWINERTDKALDNLWRSVSPFANAFAVAARTHFAKLPYGPACLKQYDALSRWLQEPIQFGRMRRLVSHKQA